MDNNENNNDIPEGFDEPTGPFANKNKSPAESMEAYDSFAEADAQAAFDREQELEEPDSDADNAPAEHDRVAELEQEVAKMKDQALRALAEAENARRRATKDREDASRFAVSGFARDLLAVSDNLRRALESVPEDVSGASDQFTNLLAGVEATERELLKIFEKHGIQKIAPMDEKFDPNFHEVMFEAPMPDKEAGTVIQVMEAGYILNGRLIRPARVGVAKGDAASGNTVNESV